MKNDSSFVYHHAHNNNWKPPRKANIYLYDREEKKLTAIATHSFYYVIWQKSDRRVAMYTHT